LLAENQQHGIALLFWQLAHYTPDIIDAQLVFLVRLDVFACDSSNRIDLPALPLVAALQVPHGIERDAVEPAGEFCAAVETSERIREAQSDGLCHVLRVALVPKPAKSRLVDKAIVLGN
jgi:hypothetical protein